MATRLEITHGLIAERDRLSTSADTLSVTRPTTGSKTRSKGVLFVVVGSTLSGPRAREASALVAASIRHEYYYDESAGVPVRLEKAVKSADRRLRSSREGAGLPPGSLGVAAAVIRNNELYLATVGAVEAYLVRSARLLMPDRSAPAGLPSDDSRSIDVWRGELSVGDELLLVSRNVTETVGTEELKSAVLTLHPQAAAEHLHHLFVAAGGEGSDAIITIEAGEATTRSGGRGAPVVVSDAYGDLPNVMSEPVGGAVGATLLGARGAVDGVVDRMWQAMPRRHTKAHQVEPQTSRAETQRRAAMGLMALVGVIFLVGLVVILVPRGGDVTEVEQIAGSDNALASALDSTDRADNLIDAEPDAALEFYRSAWSEVERARSTGLSAPALDQLETRVRSGLDSLYGAKVPVIERVTALPQGTDPVDLVEGSRKGAFYIDSESSIVERVNLKNGKISDVVHEGDKPSGSSKAIAGPTQLAAAGPDVVIVDDQGRPWGWRSSNSAAAGTLRKITLQGGSPTFLPGHGDVEAYDPDFGDYRMYVVEPELNQVMRYQQTFDRSAFSPPSPYLASQTAEVADFVQLYIDFDVYALIDNTLRRHTFGKYDGAFALGDPPDGDDLRRGSDYQIVAGSGTSATNGRVYLYDSRHDRIVGFSKADGSYLGQWAPKIGGTEMADIRGMYVIPGDVNKKGKRKDDTLVWITPDGVFRAVLPIG
jgi:hypothetical protein